MLSEFLRVAELNFFRMEPSKELNLLQNSKCGQTELTESKDLDVKR